MTVTSKLAYVYTLQLSNDTYTSRIICWFWWTGLDVNNLFLRSVELTTGLLILNQLSLADIANTSYLDMRASLLLHNEDYLVGLI